jgi:hypothetical protein
MMKFAVWTAALLISAGWSAAQDVRRSPTPADRAQVLAAGWEASRDKLGAALSAAYQTGGPGRPGSTGNTAYRQWLNLWKWSELLTRTEKAEAARLLSDHLRIAPDGDRTFYGLGYAIPSETRKAPAEDVNAILANDEARAKYLGALVPAEFANPADAPIAARLKPEILAEWVNDEELSRLLFQNLAEEDYAPAVLARLQEIRLAHPAKFRDYRALAVALALVYDQNLPQFWPHRQVEPNLIPRRPIDVAAFFGEWVKSNESRELLLDVRKLGPGQLKFLVDAPVEASEFSWARKNVRYPRMDFAKAFSSVVYDHGRLKRKEYDWTEESYTLEDVRRKGGICVDQAYYAMIAGKARGLPTLFFSGQGSDGGHAWFGYMKADDKWELDCGRYENQNYAVGEALDPQIWRPISDHDLEFLARSFRDKLEFAASQDDIRMAARFEAAGETDRAAKAYENAIQVCPENILAWDARAAYLVRSGAPVNQRRAFHEAAIRQFARDRDIRSRQQAALAGVLREQGDSAAATALEAQIMSSNKRQRSDLSVSMAAQKLSALVDAKKFDAAFAEYQKLLAGLGKTGGGNFFYDIVRPFAFSLAEAGDRKRALEAVTMAQKALKPEGGSILDEDMKELAEVIRKPAA